MLPSEEARGMWQVIGQPRTVSLLQRSLEAGNLAHAYLLVGPPHVGKMTLAVNLAQALNCLGEAPPCGECPACLKIAAGNHADVQVIGLSRDGENGEAKLIGIEQIKDLQHDASLPPFEGRHKVFIIEGAELLSIEAANRLLKTLEEPGEKVTFILLTVNERLLPATVVSRCQRLELPPLPIEAAAALLEKENGLAPEEARRLAGFAHGCPGWALAALGDESLLRQRREEMDGIAAAIAADSDGRFAYAARLATRFGQNRGAVYDVLDLWLDYYRDLMLLKLGRDDLMTNTDRRDELTRLAGGYTLSQIEAFIETIQATARQLRQNVNARLALEVMMLDIPRHKGGEPGNRSNRVSVKYG
jgi:DNA polymerase-3 subunit delta'